jgi:hypothetical protein
LYEFSEKDDTSSVASNNIGKEKEAELSVEQVEEIDTLPEITKGGNGFCAFNKKMRLSKLSVVLFSLMHQSFFD